MPSFFDLDIPFPPPLKIKALAAGKGKGSVRASSSQHQHQEQAPPRRMSWTKLGCSFAGVRKRYHRNHSSQEHKRRHSVQELGEWPSSSRSETLPALRERRDMDVDMAVSEGEPSGVSGSEVSGAGLCRVLTRFSTDSDWTAVPSEGSATPSASVSRVSSFNKDPKNAFAYEDDKGVSPNLTSEPYSDWPAMASESDFTSPTIKLVKKTKAREDDDLAYVEQMLNGPQVFIPANPYIYDGPITVQARRPPMPRRRLASVKSQ